MWSVDWREHDVAPAMNLDSLGPVTVPVRWCDTCTALDRFDPPEIWRSDFEVLLTASLPYMPDITNEAGYSLTHPILELHGRTAHACSMRGCSTTYTLA